MPPKAFLGDASERNVIVDHGKISGIIDVDEMFFGDPLFVVGLTYVALETEGHDTLYPDAWVKLLELDSKAQDRLSFYRLYGHGHRFGHKRSDGQMAQTMTVAASTFL